MGLTSARCPVSLLALLGLYLQTLGLAGPLGSAPTILYIIFFYLFPSSFFAVFSFFVNISKCQQIGDIALNAAH